MKGLKYFIGSLMILLMGTFLPDLNAQCEGFENYPGGEDKGKVAHALYRDQIKLENLDKAFELWEEVMKYSPAGHVLHYIDGVKFYSSKIQQTEDSKKIKEYTQKIVDLYEARIECLSPERNDEGTVREFMAYDLFNLNYDRKKTYEVFKRAVELEGNETDAYIIISYADHAARMFANDELTKVQMQQVYTSLTDVIDANVEDEEYKNAMTYVNDYLGPYTDHFFTCDFYLDKFKVDYEKDPNNPDVFRPMLKKLLGRKCDKSIPFIAKLLKQDSLYVVEQQRLKLEKWKVTDPDFYAIEIQEQDPEQATEYFKKALEVDGISADRKSYAAFQLGIFYHRNNAFSSARVYYFKAAEFRGGWGEPYYQIGMMYAASGRMCSGDGPNKLWDSKVVLWAAIDMWERAKNVDPSMASKANERITAYRAHLPTREDGFQRVPKVSSGDTYKIGCWINVTTTARLQSQF